jgi:hypothetical protein
MTIACNFCGALDSQSNMKSRSKQPDGLAKVNVTSQPLNKYLQWMTHPLPEGVVSSTVWMCNPCSGSVQERYYELRSSYRPSSGRRMGEQR